MMLRLVSCFFVTDYMQIAEVEFVFTAIFHLNSLHKLVFIRVACSGHSCSAL